MDKYPQLNKGVSKLQYDSFRKTGRGHFISSLKALVINFLLAIKTSTNQPPRHTINMCVVTDHAFWPSDLLNRINLSSPAALRL